MNLVNIKEIESKVEREFNERYLTAEKIRSRAFIVMHGKKGIAQCEHTGIEIPCLELGGDLYSKFGDTLPDNWIWRPAMSRKAAALLIGMLIGSIVVIALIRSGSW
jgi:hypothetical protein